MTRDELAARFGRPNTIVYGAGDVVFFPAPCIGDDYGRLLDHLATLAPEEQAAIVALIWPPKAHKEGEMVDVVVPRSVKDKAEFTWRSELRDMTDDQRVEFLATLAGLFCKHCGSSYLPCHCENDE